MVPRRLRGYLDSGPLGPAARPPLPSGSAFSAGAPGPPRSYSSLALLPRARSLGPECIGPARGPGGARRGRLRLLGRLGFLLARGRIGPWGSRSHSDRGALTKISRKGSSTAACSSAAFFAVVMRRGLLGLLGLLCLTLPVGALRGLCGVRSRRRASSSKPRSPFRPWRRLSPSSRKAGRPAHTIVLLYCSCDC